jgi:hypothetical protein
MSISFMVESVVFRMVTHAACAAVISAVVKFGV